MRNILALFLMLFLLTSCGVESSGSTSQESTTSSLEQAVMSNELVETSDVNASTSETSLPDSVFSMDEPYSFSEVNSLLGPGPFSVNELSEIFGEPSWVYGYYNDSNSEAGYYTISVMFRDVMFDLAANNGEELNLTSSEDGKYKVPDTAMDIKLNPRYTSVLSGDWALPRGIKLGDSIDSLYKAYNDNKGTERFAQGLFLVSYAYGTSGSIVYHFDGTSIDGVIGEVEQVTISWYQDSEPDNSTQTPKTPSPPA